MKQILPLLFLFFGLSSPVNAAIDFQIGSFEKVNDYYSVEAEITGAASGSAYYIQAAFTKPEENSYFGYTWGQKGEWFKYISSPDKELIKSDFPILPSGQKQKFLIKPDIESSKYGGPGTYVLKLKRYTGESSSGYYSNAISVTLSDNPSPSPAPITTETPTPTVIPTAVDLPANAAHQALQAGESPSSTPTKTPTSTKTPTKTPTVLITQTKTPTPSKPTVTPTITVNIPPPTSSPSGTVLGESTPSSPTIISPTSSPAETSFSRNETNIYKFTFLIGAVLFAVSGTWLYLRHKTD